MEFLGIGPLELLLILILGLIVFSPKDIARGGRSAGKFLNRLYRSDSYKAVRQVSQELQTLPSRLAREAQMDELKELEKEINTPIIVPAIKKPEDPAPTPDAGSDQPPPQTTE
jgi:Sec-independent protein translocase protein TatA